MRLCFLACDAATFVPDNSADLWSLSLHAVRLPACIDWRSFLELRSLNVSDTALGSLRPLEALTRLLLLAADGNRLTCLSGAASRSCHRA